MNDTTSKSQNGAQVQQGAQQNSGATLPENKNTDKKTWTIIIDIAADSNLANFAIETLKQLNATANPQVKIVVQFSIDAPGGQQIPRYIFTEPRPKEPISASLAGILNAPKNMTEEEALASFLHWVFYEEHKNIKSDYYALILWGHGPELLFQPPSGRIPTDPCGDPGDDNNGLFLTPIELRNALETGLKPNFKKPDGSNVISVIAFDACSMANFEVAYEIRDYVDFMIASQEEVPDLSFPYDRLVTDIKEYIDQQEGDPEKLCQNLVNLYGIAYRDYICNANTGMKKVTLSAIRLRHLCDLRKALACLVYWLYKARKEPGLPDLLIDCRARAKGFAGGLYVDIFNFCDKLRTALAIPPVSEKLAEEIINACIKVCNALLLPDDQEHNEDNCILANQASDTCECHGLSIYFPYMTDDEMAQTRQPLVKGGTDTVGKGFTAIMNRVAGNVLLCIRRGLIIDTETYYADLLLAFDTCWSKFIATMWTRSLVLRLPADLDLRYSAQQAAVNLLKPIFCTNKLCCENSSTETGASTEAKIEEMKVQEIPE